MSERDLLVLGGGITGLAVARLAARSGWSVTLIERDDLASGASSASSHMLHGGLRYLEHGHFSLVREALAERAAVAHMAPALATPVRFLAPLRRGGRVGPLRLRAGLMLYDLLAGGASPSPHALVSARQATALEPALAARELRGAGVYTDLVVDDARLAMLVARDAIAHGAAIHTHTDLLALRPGASGAAGPVVEVSARDRLSGADLKLSARVIVNATGAWTDATRMQVLRMLRPGAPDPAPLLRPSRGVHLVYPALTQRHGVVITAASDGRVFFVVPFAGRSLVGTTEVEVASPPAPGEAAPSVDEVRYLASEVARVLPGAESARPLAVFAGVRPLLDARAQVGGASREHRVLEEGPLVSVAGGKYTTFRVMARDTLAVAALRLGRAAPLLPRVDTPLPAPLHAEADAVALGAHAVEHECARTLAGVLRRRSTRWLADDRGLGVAADVAGAMARRLGWSATHEREQLDEYEALVREEQSLLARALDPLHGGTPA
ncbi:MAG: glycerol-3-phosphate dehydrogenase/oxidase [Candidatus Eisenbacteria bacterium]|uniref:Glycerol-3-phosphate dehydrogenase/oxidase n=1 Tax=Eiseniibacteriota bacterium TaxID=2212470 RepID=A0A933SAR2_UNCEI|nr:glycerol-3-phosphate dehydrogenase/oxidase [Candidatus Eisenbacteria bacterium]